MRRLLAAAALREWKAAKRAAARPLMRWLLDRVHAWLADVPREVIREAIRQSFRGDAAGVRRAAAEARAIRAILGNRLQPADAALLAMIEAAANDFSARMN